MSLSSLLTYGVLRPTQPPNLGGPEVNISLPNIDRYEVNDWYG